jgi:hypothetical protein
MRSSSDADQARRFKEVAIAAECDEDAARWEARLKAVAKHKPKPDQPKPE